MTRYRIAICATTALALVFGILLLQTWNTRRGQDAELARLTTSRINEPELWDIRRHHDDYANGNPWYWHCAGSARFHGTVYLISDRLGRRVVTEYDLNQLAWVRSRAQPIGTIDLLPQQQGSASLHQ